MTSAEKQAIYRAFPVQRHRVHREEWVQILRNSKVQFEQSEFSLEVLVDSSRLVLKFDAENVLIDWETTDDV